MTTACTVIVLAAGRGSRFLAPGHKLVQPLGESSVLATTLANALASGLAVVVVTTQSLAAVARSSVAARDVVVLPEAGGAEPMLGMGASIAAGASARPDAAGWLVLPGDMPLVRPETLQSVARALDQHPVAFAQHRGRRGHPVGFAAELYSELIGLQGDEGARRLVARYPALGLELADPGVLVDVDTAADLEAVRRQHGPAAAVPAGGLGP